MAQIALAGENTFAALFEGLVVEREHGAIGVAIDAAEFAADARFRGLGGRRRQQAVLRSLDASKLFRFAAEFQSSADPHGG